MLQMECEAYVRDVVTTENVFMLLKTATELGDVAVRSCTRVLPFLH